MGAELRPWYWPHGHMGFVQCLFLLSCGSVFAEKVSVFLSVCLHVVYFDHISSNDTKGQNYCF